jgi:uncharacterized protein (DUF58 family)
VFTGSPSILDALKALRLPRAGEDRTSGEAVLSRQRVYILPTRYGWSYAGVLLVMLVGSVNYNNSLGHLLSFLLASLALVSMLHTQRNLLNLRLRAGHVSPAFPGQQALFRLCLHNDAPVPRRGLEITYRAGRRSVRTSVSAAGVGCVELPLTARTRGWLRLKEVTVSTRYPLGLFRAWSPVRLGAACLVYPGPAGARPLPAGGSPQGQDDRWRGEAREDFAGFRDYRPGDAPRQVYWKAAAREQGLMVKLFAGGGAGQVLLTWEDAGPGHLEARLSQLCAWLLEAHRRGLGFGMTLPDSQIPPGEGEAHLHRCLYALAVYGEKDD